MIIELFSIIGMLISVYAFKTELKSKHNKKYKSFCDKNNKVSCTKTFSSKYGHILGIPNSLFGIVYYLILFLLLVYSSGNLIFPLTLLAFLGSIFLAYLSFVKLKVTCLICISIYLINIILLISSYFRI